MGKLSRRGFLQFASLIGAAATLGYQPISSRAKNGEPVTQTYGSRQAINLTAQQDASRFLAQATFGANLALIQHVANIGHEAWLNEQFSLPVTDTFPIVSNGATGVEGILPITFRWAHWQQMMTSSDVLRQRVVFALSQLLVISTQVEELGEEALGMSSYYDLFQKHAFGNFRDLLFDVTMHPFMGIYLSHLKNRKTDLTLNRFPDENYAREVMQLFTIGLYELNPDGSYQLDANGNPIPTYTNAEITEFAKVFTGLTTAPEKDDRVIDLEYFLENDSVFHRPMVMYDGEHEPGEKKLLKGFVIPAGQTGMKDINDAVDNLFNHPNVGPFIGHLLIQRLVKSNPSPAYISRVTAAFNDNGSGVRGDLKAVIKAILLDSEARDTSHFSDPTHGKLREPFVRYVQLCRSFNAASPNGLYRNSGNIAQDMLQQYPFHPPSVFNFFLPSYQPLGPIANANLVAPEFQITTSYTAISAINFMDLAINGEYPMEISNPIIENCEDLAITCPELTDEEMVTLTLTEELNLAENDMDAFIEHLNLLLTYGTLSADMKTIIKNAITPLKDSFERVNMALYLLMISPEYAILK